MALNLGYVSMLGAIDYKAVYKTDFAPIQREISKGIQAIDLATKKIQAGKAADLWNAMQVKYSSDPSFWDDPKIKILVKKVEMNLNLLLAAIRRLDAKAAKVKTEAIQAEKTITAEDVAPIEEEPAKQIPWLPLGIGAGIIGFIFSLKG